MNAKKGIKLIIAGSRDLHPSFGFIDNAIKILKPYKRGPIVEVISGKCRGVDTEGEHWASHRDVPVKPFPVKKKDWDRWGKAAGPRRNKKMAEYGDALLLIHWEDSKGSLSMKKEMLERNKPVYEIILKKHS